MGMIPDNRDSRLFSVPPATVGLELRASSAQAAVLSVLVTHLVVPACPETLFSIGAAAPAPVIRGLTTRQAMIATFVALANSGTATVASHVMSIIVRSVKEVLTAHAASKVSNVAKVAVTAEELS